MALTGRTPLVAALAAAVVAAVAPSWWGVLGTLLVLVVLVAVDVAAAPSVRRLVVQRRGKPSVRLGGTVVSTLIVANPTSRRLRGRLRDSWAPGAGAATQRHAVEVPPGEARRVTTTLTPTRRGDRHPYRVTVLAVGPLGLAGRQSSLTVPGRVRVLPPFTSRKHLPSRLARLRELDGRTALRVRGQGTEFDSLRDYVAGDDVRAIDWRATARRSAVVVRTWRPERDRRILVVLDTGRAAAGRVGDAPRLDAAMDAALLLAALATRAGDRVDLLAYDRSVRARVEAAAPSDVLRLFVEAMAPLEAGVVETDARGLVAAAMQTLTRRGLVVLLTGLDAATVEDGLLPALGPLAHRHTLVVASVGDPAVEALAAGREDSAAVYAAAAAERTRAERARVTGLLERRRVVVVDAPPDDLPPRLADAYLALKAAGRL